MSCCVAMSVDRNDPKARQLLEKLLKKGVPPSPRARDEVVVPIASVGQAEGRSPVRARGQDCGKRPMAEEGEPLLTKRPRTKERDEEAIVPPPTIHPERMKDFLDTARLVLSGEMSWKGVVGNESTYATSTAMAFKKSVSW